MFYTYLLISKSVKLYFTFINQFFLLQKRLRVIEKERQDRIDELVVKRKDKEERIEQQRLEREKERLKVASEKARFSLIFSIQYALYIFFLVLLYFYIFWLLYF